MTTTRALSALLLALAVGACATKTPDRVADARTPTEHFEAKARPASPEMLLAIHAQGLSDTQADALAALAADWQDSEGGPIVVRTPAGGANGASAFRAAETARTFLINRGVPQDRVVIEGYDPKGEAGAPLRLTYVRYQAVVPACGRVWSNVAHSADNEVQRNFGCAVTANFAAQVANAGDLAAPRDMSPPDAMRRQTVLDKYRKGEVTGAEKDTQASGAISKAVQ